MWGVGGVSACGRVSGDVLACGDLMGVLVCGCQWGCVSVWGC